MLSDCYKDVNYLLDEEKYAEAESLDLFRKRFIRAWEALTEHYQVIFCSIPLPIRVREHFAAIQQSYLTD